MSLSKNSSLLHQLQCAVLCTLHYNTATFWAADAIISVLIKSFFSHLQNFFVKNCKLKPQKISYCPFFAHTQIYINRKISFFECLPPLFNKKGNRPIGYLFISFRPLDRIQCFINRYKLLFGKANVHHSCHTANPKKSEATHHAHHIVVHRKSGFTGY